MNRETPFDLADNSTRPRGAPHPHEPEPRAALGETRGACDITGLAARRSGGSALRRDAGQTRVIILPNFQIKLVEHLSSPVQRFRITRRPNLSNPLEMAIPTNGEDEVGFHRAAPQFSKKMVVICVGSSVITENPIATKTSAAWDDEECHRRSTAQW